MSDIKEGTKRQLRYVHLIGKVGPYILQKYLIHMISKSDKTLEEMIQENNAVKRSLKDKQIETRSIDITNWDISLLAEIILKLFTNAPKGERTLIRSIRDKRNDAFHAGNFELDDINFNESWDDLSSLFYQLARGLSRDVKTQLQEMINNCKMTQIADIKSVNDLSDFIRHVQEYLSDCNDSEDTTKRITETIQILETMDATCYRQDIQLHVSLHGFDGNTKQEFKDLFLAIINRTIQTAGSMERHEVSPVIQALKEQLTCDGENTVMKAIDRCILIRIRCPTLNGLLKLLQFVTSEAYNGLLQQLSDIFTEKRSKEIRITSSIAKASMDRLSAFLDGSKEVDVAENWNMCDEHPDKPIEYFCTKHDVTCCNSCRVSEHKSCLDVRLLEEMKGIKDVEVPQMLTDLTNIYKNINDTKTSFERELSQLMDAREQFESEIFAQRMELLEAVKKLEKQQEDCARHYNRLEQEKGHTIETEITSCEIALKDIELLKTSLESSQSQSEDIQIIAYKKCKSKIPESKVLVREMQQKQEEIAIPEDELKYERDPIQFADNDFYQSLQADIVPYKETHIKAFVPAGPEHKLAKPATKSQMPVSKKSEEPKHKRPLSSKAVTVTKAETVTKVNVSFKEDVGPSAIFGCCVTSGGDILVADNTNKCLKRIKDNQVNDFVGLSGHPWDVCVTGSHTAAVAIFSNALQFVSTEGHMTVGKPMKLPHACRSLAFEKVSQRLAIIDHSNVYLYTKSGTKERVLYSQPSASISLRRIAVSPCGKQYCISTTGEDLIVIDNTGRELKKSKLKESVDGICYSAELNLYVCLTDSVLRLNKQMKINRKIKRGISRPKSLCCTDSGSELVVGQDNDILTVVAI